MKYTFTPAQFNRNNKNPVIGKRFIPESLVSRSAGQGERRLWERDCRGVGYADRAEKRLRMPAIVSFWRIFDRLINERLAP